MRTVSEGPRTDHERERLGHELGEDLTTILEDRVAEAPLTRSTSKATKDRAIPAQRIEIRPPVAVQCHHLAVEHGVSADATREVPKLLEPSGHQRPVPGP